MSNRNKLPNPNNKKENRSLSVISSSHLLMLIVGLFVGLFLYTNLRIESVSQKMQEQNTINVIIPTNSPSSSPSLIPTPTLVIKQPTKDSAGERKEKEIEKINNQINQISELQKGDIELLRIAAETLKKCTSEWCIDTLKKEAEYWQGKIKEKDEQIEAFEQQRATIVSGL